MVDQIERLKTKKPGQRKIVVKRKSGQSTHEKVANILIIINLVLAKNVWLSNAKICFLYICGQQFFVVQW